MEAGGRRNIHNCDQFPFTLDQRDRRACNNRDGKRATTAPKEKTGKILEETKPKLPFDDRPSAGWSMCWGSADVKGWEKHNKASTSGRQREQRTDRERKEEETSDESLRCPAGWSIGGKWPFASRFHRASERTSERTNGRDRTWTLPLATGRRSMLGMLGKMGKNIPGPHALIRFGLLVIVARHYGRQPPGGGEVHQNMFQFPSIVMHENL